MPSQAISGHLSLQFIVHLLLVLEVEYKGCFPSIPSDHDPDRHRVHDGAVMSYGFCERHCAGFRYMGIQVRKSLVPPPPPPTHTHTHATDNMLYQIRNGENT